MQSILRQTWTDWELLVLDDGSSDGAAERLAGLGDPRIIVIADGHNRGLSARLNQAADVAKGRYFARMDHDDVCHPERLARQVEFLEAHPTVDLLATQAVTMDESERLVGLFSSYEAHRDICKRPWLGFSMAHPTWMARLEWIKRYRYRDPGPYCCEDQELLLRAYRDSEYATLPDRLLAYRVRTHTPWRKLWRTRVALASVQRRYFVSRREWGRAALSLVAAMARVGSDVPGEIRHRLGLSKRSRVFAFLSSDERQWWSGYLAELDAAVSAPPKAEGGSKVIALIAHHAESLLKFRCSWIRDLHAAGHRVLCLAPDYTSDHLLAVRALGAQPVSYRLHRTGVNPLRDLRDALALVVQLQRIRPDVTFAFSTKPVIYGTLAAWLARVPRRVAMIEGVGYMFTDSGQPLGRRRRVLRGLVARLYRTALLHAHRVVFLNRDDRDEFVARRLVAGDRTAVLGGIGVDLDVWTLAAPVLSPVTFLLVARLLREKGIVEYVSAARRVRVNHPEAQFLLLGGLDSNPGGLQRSEVQSWVDAGLVRWLGHTEVMPWLAHGSVFVLPSYREGVPRSTQEAMAVGRPVITTDVPGCRETVVDGVNGYLVPVRDVDALAEAMIRFIEDPDKIAVMGRESRRMAEVRFDARVVNARLTALVLGDEGLQEQR